MSGVLSLQGVTAGYGGGVVLRDVTLGTQAGAVVAVVGGNGAGKSTLFKVAMGLVPVRTGSIGLDGRSMTHLAPEARAALGLAYVPQGRRVFPGLTTRENLEVACRAGRGERLRRLQRVEALLPQLAAHRGVRAWQLSGGQQQMLAVGRALMNAPKLVLMDEPLLGLSPLVAEEILAHIQRLAGDGVGVLMADASIDRALGLADRIYVLRSGRVALSGSAAELRERPELLADFAGSPD